MSVVTPATSRPPAALPWNPAAIRSDFPMLDRRVRGQRLAYLDNAATALKPTVVIEAMAGYHHEYSANVARGVHTTSQEATDRFEETRALVASWIGAAAADEVVFTSGTTASLNLVAQSHGLGHLRSGDEILVSEMEHHSNIVPWQLVAERAGARVRGIPITDAGRIDVAALRGLLSERTRIVAICHVSNVLGTEVAVREIADLAHEAGAVCVVDGAQAAPHFPVDVQALGCDFYALSGHKVFGPTGVGILWGRGILLASMPPWQGGGGMIAAVEIERSTYAEPPARFEAGTPPIAEAIGLGAAIRYMSGWDRAAALVHERELVTQAVSRLTGLPGVRCFGPDDRIGVVSFAVEGIHPHDVGTTLDSCGVAVRAGHHCAQPLMKRFGVGAMVRASFAPYNTSEDVDALITGVEQAQRVFGQ